MPYLDKIATLPKSNFVKLFLLLIFLLSLLFFLKPLFADYYPDFSSYYYGARTIPHGGNPYLGGENFFGPFLYPPFALLFFLPFTFVSFFIAQKIFVVLSILCLLLSFFILFKLFKISFFSLLAIFLLTLVFNFFPEKFTLGMGQINNVVLLLMSLFIYFYMKKREYLAGSFLAIAIMLKLSPILLVLFLLIDKRWKVLLATGISLFIMALAVVLFVTPSNNIYFLETVLPSLVTSWWKADYYNQALSGFLQRDIPNIFLRQILKTFLDIVLLVSSLFFIWKYRTKNDSTRLLSLSILMTLSLVINAFSWQHHFVWLLIPLLITFVYIKKNHLHMRFYILLGISYVLVAINLKNPSVVPTILQSHVLYGTLLLYILDIYLLISFSRNRIKK